MSIAFIGLGAMGIGMSKNLLNAGFSVGGYDINADSVVERIRELKPDIILVYGTSLVTTKVIENVPFVLNLNGGLSPY